MVSISIYSIFNFTFVSISTSEGPITGKPMDFISEVEDEGIRDAVSQKLDRPLVNPSNELFRDSTQTKSLTSPFQISDSFRYTS